MGCTRWALLGLINACVDILISEPVALKEQLEAISSFVAGLLFLLWLGGWSNSHTELVQQLSRSVLDK